MWRAVAALLFVAASSAAQADARVLRFVSDVAIKSDSAVEVRESVDVQTDSLHSQQISRNFPDLYESRAGSQARSEFRLEAATVDGVKAPVFFDSYQNGITMIVGDHYRLFRPGLHRFVIRYRITNRVDRLKDFDELYWNATGGDWASPIGLIEVRIHERSVGRFEWSDAHTEYRGSTLANVRLVGEEPGEIVFRSTRPLQAYESLIVAVGIPGGLLPPLSKADRRSANRPITQSWRSGPVIVGFLCLLATLLFYIAAWSRVKRDRLRPGVVVPIYSPPDNLSPPAVRYLLTRRCDDRAVAAALVDLALRGHVHLGHLHDPGMFKDTLNLKRRFCDDAAPIEEMALLAELAIPGQTITIGPDSFARICAAKDELKEALKRRYQKTLFKPNHQLAVAGWILFFGALWVTSASIIASADQWDLQVVGFGVLAFFATAFLALIPRSHSIVGQIMRTTALFIAGTITAAFALFTIPVALNTGWWQPIAIPMVALPLVLSSTHWMVAPTRHGREILDHIAGFQAYLTRAEHDRLDQMTGFKDKQGAFERNLPYAIALGLENHWADAFESAVKEAGSILGPYRAPSLSSVVEAIKYAAHIRSVSRREPA